MDQDRDPNRRDGQDNRGSSGSNLILYALILGVAVMLLLMFVLKDKNQQIIYSDLIKLIHNCSPDGSGELVVSRDGSTVRYSKLRDIEIGKQAVTGKVARQVLKSADGKVSQEPEEVEFFANLSTKDGSEDDLREGLAEAKIPLDFKPAASAWERYMPLLVFTALLLLLFFFMMRRMGGTGSAMAFGRSRGKLYAQEDLGVSFDDVAGIDEAVEELREVVDFLRNSEKYQKLGGRIPKGVLLVGPPGTGKTLLAKAIAGEANAPFFGLSGSDFVEMFVGVGAARVRDMFQQAEGKAPCIIFIDELDALGKTRGSGMVGGHDEREQTLNALLVEMDGFDSNAGIIVMAATNRPEMLDPALLRPGRFDRQVLVDRPDVRGREEILKVHVQHVKLAPNVDLKKIASISSGFVGADLANLVNEAALLAARKDKSAVSMEEFDEGVERVMAGLEKKQRVIHEDEKQRVAYHEAGHALVAHSLPGADPVHKVSIIPRGLAALGYTMQRPEGDRYLLTQSELEARIQVLLAGQIAERMVYDEISTGAQNDLERATEIARSMVMDFGMSGLGQISYRDSPRAAFIPTGEERARLHSEQTMREIDEEVKQILDKNMGKARSILEVRKPALLGLTERLIEVESINSDELQKILQDTYPGPVLSPGTADVQPRKPEADGDKQEPDKPAEAEAGG